MTSVRSHQLRVAEPEPDLKSGPVLHLPARPCPCTTKHCAWPRARRGREGRTCPAHSGDQCVRSGGGWSPAALPLPLTDQVLSFPPSSPQVSSPKLARTWSRRQRRSSFRGRAKNSSPPVHSKCPGPPASLPGPPALLPAGGVRPLRLRPAATQPPRDGLPAASTWRAGHHGQVFSGRGPRPSPPAIHTFLKQRTRHQGAKSRENICFWVSKARGSSCC